MVWDGCVRVDWDEVRRIKVRLVRIGLGGSGGDKLGWVGVE